MASASARASASISAALAAASCRRRSASASTRRRCSPMRARKGPSSPPAAAAPPAARPLLPGPREGAQPARGSPSPGCPLMMRTREASDNDLVLSAPDDDDFAYFFQPADDAHDLLLGLFHVPQPHGSEEFDLLPQHFRSPFGHVAENALRHLLAGRLEGKSPVPGVHFPDDL